MRLSRTVWCVLFCVVALGWSIATKLIPTGTAGLLQPKPARILPFCSVQPLPEIQDATALSFEENLGSAGVVNTDQLTPRTGRALARFEKIVRSVGGFFALTSAYRPAAYQAHLQAVWDKWMVELRNNQEPGCQSLRAQVEKHFRRHGLLESRRPVLVSDHTLGVGFDAAVIIPAKARFQRRRVTIDRLARLSGFLRPEIRRDPVHFRLVGGRTSALRAANVIRISSRRS